MCGEWSPKPPSAMNPLDNVEVSKALPHRELNFWKTAKGLNGFWDVMVDEKFSDNLLQPINKLGIDHIKTIDDVQKLIMTKEHRKRPRRLHDDSSRPFYDFNRYGSYGQMVSWMRALAREDPQHVKFISIGTSHEGRSIDGVEIGGRDRSKRIFWIDGGIHAREWAAPHTALYFVHQLTSRHKSDPTIMKLLEHITFVIVPCVNPDGYEFTRSSGNPHIRLWRKNRSAMQCRKDSWGRNRCCRGVDLNRNFDFHFKESGSSDDPCSEIYQGTGPFSEPETRAVRDAILSKRYRGRVDAFITLHTYSQIWIHPYGHRKDSYPGDIQELYDVGKKAAKALEKVYGTKYVVGSGADTLYPASGGSEDWAKHAGGVKYVYLLELRPDEKNWDGFILGENELIPTARETWEGVKVVASAVMDRVQNKVNSIEAPTARRFRFGDGTEGSCYDVRHACKRWVADRPGLCKTLLLSVAGPSSSAEGPKHDTANALGHHEVNLCLESVMMNSYDDALR
ncbi:unnamed protein product [Nippostrongylus brasiliensis]|uniref:Peptidase_M14 domain-containing protein n=1 Tax=Nippostrongylus brasiliensis TaxID=27835 RepID=A0A158QXK1_NIPBR|nr:unnamed protein product [Nippostrongylus brasiliensis]